MEIFVFGDSITQGFYDTEKGGWVNRLFANLNEERDVSKGEYFAVYNLGIDGNSTTDVMARMESEIKSRAQGDEAVTILDIGGNDCLRNIVSQKNATEINDFVSNYQALISTGQKYGKVICLGLHDSNAAKLNPIPWDLKHALLAEDCERYDAEIQRLAQTNQALYVVMKGILSKDFSELTYDGDHPNPTGHQRIFESVKKALKSGLEK